ncbi:bestrophin-like domain [Flavisphingomonas formosensis]|uniref:bestrophin-like domain n=1 Tax=Flavisphingomonas formosensis TaxID=861534 RepID=UPI0012F8B751|nr:hypothetical protein [Sphingomonas formosensis]
MDPDRLFQSAPLWLIGFAMLLLFVLLCEAGIRLRALRPARSQKSDAEGYLLSAALALLGLLIGFTFSMALGRYDVRREHVITEANAIGTAWLRAGLIEGEAGRHLQASIARYADVRLRLVAPDAPETAIAERETGAAQTALWSEMTPLVRATPTPLAASLVGAMNDMFDAASARRAERDARVPARVLEVLILYSSVSALFVGFVLGPTLRIHRVLAAILFALLALALVMILDLDRPQGGSIIVSQAPMQAARAAMR